ncbi:MAG TPA: hypothetical protein PKG48_02735 [Bacteroidales bacterium]|nr:hypothetical protein [Bacteroidales bacterium]HPS62531.1 hypothetical protein [Bacteroidales bacterium]
MKRNKIIITVVLLLLGILFVVTTCYRSGSKKAALPPGTHGTEIKEVIQTSNYTYLRVVENEKEYWMAVVRAEVKPGDSVYYTRASEMQNFSSRELGRTFPSILFVDDPSSHMKPAAPASNQPLSPKKVEVKEWSDISVTPPPGGITLETLYKNPASFAGKSVMIRGVVTRYNEQILNRNWVHLQDGTGFEGKIDLTITTKDSVKVGQTATFKGIIGLNKDFGAGYSYEVIMEQATVTDVK